MAEDETDNPFLSYLRQKAETIRREKGIPLSATPCSNFPRLLQQPPTAQEFSNLVEQHLPVIIEGCLSNHPNLDLWKDSHYLINAMKGRNINVALTPNGRADDIVALSPCSEQNVFALPYETSIPFDQLLSLLHPSSSSEEEKEAKVAYIQSQNSNLSKDSNLLPLFKDLESDHHDLPWATQSLLQKPEAINLWIGTSKSITSLHRDPYENLFTVIRGSKTFTVFPPNESCFFSQHEKYPIYRYHYNNDKEWKLVKENDPIQTTRWIHVDPLQTHYKTDLKYSQFGLHPITITVNQGQTLYLPSGWFHHVTQVEDCQIDSITGCQLGICLCINWWYQISDDMAIRLSEMDMIPLQEDDEEEEE